MPDPFVYEQRASRVVFGPGVAALLPDELDRAGIDRVVLVATEAARGDAERLAVALGARLAGRIDAVRRHVPAARAEDARRRVEELGARGIVSLGGGSATGAAKAVALTARVPVVALPTTYSGSEMTPIWGITSDGEKRTGVDPIVQPGLVLYDPELSRDLPLDLTAASVANALAHCVEAVWAAGASRLTEVQAVEGARALRDGLRGVVLDAEDLWARGELLYGSCLAGAVLAAAGTGLHHKLCHLLGGAYDLPHAETHAAVLPQVTALNAPAVPDAAARLAAAIGADDLAAGLFDLFAEAGVPTGLRELGLAETEVEAAAARIAAADLDNPVGLDEATLRTVLGRAWAGERPEQNQTDGGRA